MATLHDRGKKNRRRYEVRWGPNGQRKRFESKAVAKQFKLDRELEAERVRAGLNPVLPAERAIWDVVEEFMPTRRDASEKRIDRYYSTYMRGFRSMGTQTLGDLDPQKVDGYLDELTDEDGAHRAAGTANQHLQCFKALSKWAHEMGYLPKHVLSSVKPRRGMPRRVRQVFSRDQLERLFAAADALLEWQGLAERLAYYQALRGREVTGLRWGDLDFDRRWIVLAPDRQKAKKSSMVPLMDEMQALLVARRAAFEADGRPTGEADPVFPGVPPSADPAFGRHHKKVVEAAGIRYKNALKQVADFHAMRHTCLTDMGNAGTPLHVLQKFARHASPDTTNRYLRVNDASIRKGQAALHQFGRAA